MNAIRFDKTITDVDLAAMLIEHPRIFKAQKRYFWTVIATISLIVFYYIYFLFDFGVEVDRFVSGLVAVCGYFIHMFNWQNIHEWPILYILEQIAITFGIVFIGTFTASFIALPLSFIAARNIMNRGIFKVIAMCMRRFFDVCRGVDMAIWGLIFVRAVGLGPLAGSLAIIVQDIGVFGKLYAEGHEAVEKRPTKGLKALGANSLQTHRFGIFTQSFPSFLALTLYQLESNTRSASVLGFVGAGGIGLVYAENMRLWNWDIVMFITIVLVAVVMLIDKLSSILRDKYIIGEEIPIFTAPQV